jgi:hypothetical protein
MKTGIFISAYIFMSVCSAKVVNFTARGVHEQQAEQFAKQCTLYTVLLHGAELR